MLAGPLNKFLQYLPIAAAVLVRVSYISLVITSLTKCALTSLYAVTLGVTGPPAINLHEQVHVLRQF